MERNLEKESFAHQCYYAYQVQKLYKFENDIYNRLNFSANNSIQWCFIITCCYQISKYQEKALLCHDINIRNVIICSSVHKELSKIQNALNDTDPHKLFHFTRCNIELTSSFSRFLLFVSSARRL